MPNTDSQGSVNVHELAWGVKNSNEFEEFMDQFSELSEKFQGNQKQEQEFLIRLEGQSRSMAEHFFGDNTRETKFDTLENSRLLKDYAAIRVDGSGAIIDANNKAMNEYELDLLKNLEANGFESYGQNGLVRQFEQLADSKIVQGDFDLVQIVIRDSYFPSTVAVLPYRSKSHGKVEYLLVILNSTSLSSITHMLAENFGLSPAESDVAEAVLAGQSLKEFAEKANKSYKTVRNQFQVVLEKSGCKSQIMFLRLSTDFAFLLRNEGILTPPIDRENYQQFEMPRPGGRKVEVVLCGDLSGKPMLVLPELLGHAISSQMISELIKEKICFISIARPGYGKTTPCVGGPLNNECFFADVIAVLDSLEIKKIPVIARQTSAQPYFQLMLALPSRFTGGYVVAGALPRRYKSNDSLTSKWTRTLLKVALTSRPILKAILSTTHRILMSKDDVSRHLKGYFTSDPDHDFLDQPGVGEFFRASMRRSSAIYGGDQRYEDVYKSLRPWGDELEYLKVPTTLLHGPSDQNLPFSEAKAFAEDFPEKIKLVPIEKAGTLAFYSHFPEILKVILKHEQTQV